MANYTVFSDGASRGNPGFAGAGYIIYDASGVVVEEKAFPLGITTNNIAEYTAVIKAAIAVSALKPERVSFRLDSELVVKQIKGEYKVKDEKLKVLFLELKSVLVGLKYDVAHVRRELNKEADRLSNVGADMNEGA